MMRDTCYNYVPSTRFVLMFALIGTTALLHIHHINNANSYLILTMH